MPDFQAPGGQVDLSSTAAPASAQPTSTQTSPLQADGPTAIDISDDTPIRGVPGFNEPVRYGDLYKRLQSDYTRKTQAAEKLRAQAAAERATHQQEIASERKRLEQLAQTLLARQSGAGSQGGPSPDDALFKELSSAQYIDGPMMGRFVQAIQERGFAPIVKAFTDRDQITQGLYNEVLRLSKAVKDLTGHRSSQDFDGKINRWLTEGGYPAEAADLAKEIYLAYEGNDLDNEFPAIFESRWNQIQTLLRNQDRQRVEAAKRTQGRIPGRGGNGSAGKPLGLKGHERPRDVASALWDAMQTNAT